MRRPAEVSAVAIYHVLFSVLLVGTLAGQAAFHPPSAGWLDAAPVLLMMLFVSLVPAVLAYGLWIMDEGARIIAIIFTALHLISTVVYLRHVPDLWRPWARLALDAVIIAILASPTVRRAFRMESRLVFDRGDGEF